MRKLGLNLKSNMDRFIGYRELYKPLVIKV